MDLKKNLFIFFISLTVIISFVFAVPPISTAAKNKERLKKRQPRRTASLKTSRPRVRVLSRDPYQGAIVVDAATGEALFEDNPDVKGYPASMVKMMNLLIVLEAVEAGKITLEDEITVSAEVSGIGGSQVYLKENEAFTVDELLYALMVQSANDAALALALHTAGSREEFVHLMNRRARDLGMNSTVFHSVHGLPPGRGQLPDVSTPRDITRLARELLRHPGAVMYASTRVRAFRADAPEPFIMRNHNNLVGDFEGCDGLKTGFFWAAGFSITATAVSDGGRAIAVIFGSLYSEVRDEKARELLSAGLEKIASKPPPPDTEVAAAMINVDRHFNWKNPYLLALALICIFYGVRKFMTMRRDAHQLFPDNNG